MDKTNLDYYRTRTVRNESDCWIWRGRKDRDGYGTTWVRVGGVKRVRFTHRMAYAAVSGEIPEGLQIDHLCRVRACCNPDHLEVVTSAVNTRRSPVALATINRNKTHCSNGHAFDVGNTYRDANGHRQCRACRLARTEKWRARNRTP